MNCFTQVFSTEFVVPLFVILWVDFGIQKLLIRTMYSSLVRKPIPPVFLALFNQRLSAPLTPGFRFLLYFQSYQSLPSRPRHHSTLRLHWMRQLPSNSIHLNTLLHRPRQQPRITPKTRNRTLNTLPDRPRQLPCNTPTLHNPALLSILLHRPHWLPKHIPAIEDLTSLVKNLGSHLKHFKVSTSLQ